MNHEQTPIASMLLQPLAHSLQPNGRAYKRLIGGGAFEHGGGANDDFRVWKVIDELPHGFNF